MKHSIQTGGRSTMGRALGILKEYSMSPPCTYCGNAPEPHILLYLESTIDILSSKVLFPLVHPFVGIFGSFASWIVDCLGWLSLKLLTSCGVITFSDDPSKAASHRTEAVWREAVSRGITMQVLVFAKRPLELARAWLPSMTHPKKYQWQYFQSIPLLPSQNTYTTPLIDDKAVLKHLFEAYSLPIPRGGGVITLSSALKKFHNIGGAVIVKPQSGSRARHTTVNITTENELAPAFYRAQELCLFVMVEEYIPGTLYRATCVGGALVGVIEFVKPSVIADGTRTVQEILAFHNTHKRFPSLTDVKDDAWFEDAITHQGYMRESVPPKGTRVLLSEHSERPNGGYFVDVTDRIPNTTKSVIEKAARVCQAHVVGFDIISKDLGDEHGRFVFIEANTLPFIELHSIPFEGTPRTVAGAIWDSWS